jgi:ribosomal protein S18 acetylase RimI-like enzyme
MSQILIRRYLITDEKQLFELLEREGEDWQDYWRFGAEKYKKALISCVTYVAFDGGIMCGYVRCREDDGFGIYVYDLLVDAKFRGRGIGRMLLERVCGDYPDQICYAMSDADGYYKKSGYQREGSIFIVKK